MQNDIDIIIDNNPRINNKYAPEIDNCGGSATAKNIIFGLDISISYILMKYRDIEG